MALIDRIRVADLEYLEDQGIDLDDLLAMGNGKVKARALTHVLYILKRHDGLTIDDIRNMPISKLVDDINALDAAGASPEA